MYLNIALPNFTNKLLTYQTKDASYDYLGYRVVVPFGKKQIVGIVISQHSTCSIDKSKIKKIIKPLGTSPLLPPEHITFLKKLADYYQVSMNTLVLKSLPPGIISEDVHCNDDFYETALSGHTPAMRKILETIEKPAALYVLMASFRQDMIKKLIYEGCLIKSEAKERLQYKPALSQLNTHQTNALEYLRNAPSLVRLLWGITGSGKTEIYAHLIHDCIKQQKQVLLLVPEISLTPQILLKITERIGIKPITIHSHLSTKQRIAHTLQARYGHAHIIIGTRSALLAPIHNLGLIIVDEEHSDAFRQDAPFFYSAKDAAIIRSALLNIPIVLGSATPSLETIHNVHNEKYNCFKLLSRFHAKSPNIHILPIEKNTIISKQLIPIVNEALNKNQHVMLYIGKRGYARVSSCHHCGFQLRCSGCERLMVKHTDGLMHCHHCEIKEKQPIDCPQCHQAELSHFGAGSQQIAEVATQHWPNHPVVRIDTDSMNTLNAAKALKTLEQSPATIIVGTQMLTKGHDIHRLNTVIVINADHGLYAPDFRSEEKLFAEITQVAGRSGRRDIIGDVYIQTMQPNHHLYMNITNPEAFYQHLFERRKTFLLPPYVHLACLFIVGKKQHLKKINQIIIPKINHTEITGPLFFPPGIKQGKECYKIMITSHCRITRDQAIKYIEAICIGKLPKYVQLLKQIDSHLSP